MTSTQKPNKIKSVVTTTPIQQNQKILKRWISSPISVKSEKNDEKEKKEKENENLNVPDIISRQYIEKSLSNIITR